MKPTVSSPPRAGNTLLLSATTLKLYLECPRCFWLQLNRNLPRPRGPFPSLPTGMDGVLKSYFNLYRRNGTLPPLLNGRLKGTLFKSELSLGFSDPGVQARLYGKLDDCLVLVDGRHAPLDHKTRASAPDDLSYSQKYYKFQMDVYTLLLERNGYPVSRTAYLVYYYPQHGQLHDGVPFGVTIHEVATEPEAAYAVFKEARQLLLGSMPPYTEACEYCKWIQACQAHLQSVA